MSQQHDRQHGRIEAEHVARHGIEPCHQRNGAADEHQGRLGPALLAEQIEVQRPAEHHHDGEVGFASAQLEAAQPPVQRAVHVTAPGHLDVLEGQRVTGEVIEIEHVGEQAERDHPEGEHHLEGALGEAEELAPAVGLQRQDQHREHHHHPQVAGGGDEDAEQGHHQPLLAIGEQEHPQHQRHEH